MQQQVTIFGAGGRVGRRTVTLALERGYNVTAFVHHAASFAVNERLRVVEGDIYNPVDVERALEGSTAVLSTLGSWGTPRKDILTVGMQHIIPTMQQFGSATIVSLTGADVRAPGDSLGLVHRLTYPLLRLFAGKIIADGERHLELLANSSLDWTVLRSPVMTTRSGGHYRIGVRRPLPWQTIPYDTVATAMVDALQDRTWRRQAVYVSK